MFKIVVLTGFIFVLQAKGGQISVCPAEFKSPQRYALIQKQTDELVEKFANYPIIAKPADVTLGKLIEAKSPIIISWMQKRDLVGADAEIIAKTWRVYYAKNFVLANYKWGDAQRDKKVEELVHGIHKLFATGTFRQEMQEYFHLAKKGALTLIKKWYVGNSNSKKIEEKIKTMQLYYLKSFRDSKFKNKPLEYIDWGLAYDPLTNEINVGIQALAYPNRETYIAVFAHEIAHAFDSCRWGAFYSGLWPFAKVGDCLRDPSSAGARSRDDSQLNAMVKQKKIGADEALALRKNPTCNRTYYPPMGLQRDQLDETFADWFSAEVSAILNLDVKKGLRIDLCEKKELNPGSSYLSNETRMQKIYFVHPKYSEVLKIKSIRYCSM